jgi:hypothetical protein
MHRSLAAGVAILLLIGLPAAGAEMPKRGGTLTYMIPADAPPSFDGHREATFATVRTGQGRQGSVCHAVAAAARHAARLLAQGPARTLAVSRS